MTNYKKIVFFIFIPLTLLVLFFLNAQKNTKVEHKRVVVSTFYLYDIVKHIVGKEIEIVNILPFGMDPHSFELSPKQMGKIQKSDLIFYSGAGLEPWVERIQFEPKAINVSRVAKLSKLSEKEAHHHEVEDEAHFDIDPHYWLDFQNMKNAVFLVSKELIKLEPKHKKEYKQRTQAYITMLSNLQTLYVKKLKKCQKHTIVLNHNFFGYVSREYHFNVESLTGLSLESQPSPNDLVRVLKTIKETNASVLFFENFANTQVLQSIAKDTGIKVAVLEPLANITHEQALEHISVEKLLQSNLAELTEALECQ